MNPQINTEETITNLSQSFAQYNILSFQNSSTGTLMNFVRDALTNLLQTILFLLSSYPLNVLIIMLTLVWIVYSVLKTFTGLNSNVTSYRKETHIEDHSILVKNIKKDLRQMQTELIHIKSKTQKALTHFQGQQEKGQLQIGSQQSEKTIATSPQEQIELANKMNAILQDISHKEEFNQKMDRELKKSMIEIVGILKKMNNN